MPIKKVLKDSGCPVKIFTEDIDVKCEDQLRNVAALPFVQPHIAVMPDVHGGIGCTIGTVLPTRKAIIPAAVGVDIGCGMMALRTPYTASDLPENLIELRSIIESAVPHGRSKNFKARDKGSWGDVPASAIVKWNVYLAENWAKLIDKYPLFKKANHINHLGTLGGGNHFIEICIDEAQNVWIMLHSGSRGVGNKIGRHFIELAQKEMEKWHIHLPDKDLAYLPEGSEYFDDYVFAVSWAQEFARVNRIIMMEAVKKCLDFTMNIDTEYPVEYAINCHHNYISREHHFGRNVIVTRKGAIRAREGDMGIIPGSMGERSFIVKGKGNAESLHSCSHGAGRVMSRTEARRRYTSDDLAAQTAGVECPKDDARVDEIPSAYKNIDTVMANQSDCVEIVHTLKQVVCVKG